MRRSGKGCIQVSLSTSRSTNHNYERKRKVGDLELNVSVDAGGTAVPRMRQSGKRVLYKWLIYWKKKKMRLNGVNPKLKVSLLVEVSLAGGTAVPPRGEG